MPYRTPLPGPRSHRRLAAVGVIFPLTLALVAGASAAAPVTTRTAAGASHSQHKVLLTIDGKIGRHNDGAKERVNLAMLRSLPRRRFVTSTIWTAGPQVFEGVLLSDFLKWLGAPRGAVVVAHGANDYESRIPASEIGDPGPIIAYRRNGARMRLRDNGPLWLVYPYDSDPRWQTEVVYAHTIWQLDRMTIEGGGGAK